MRKYIIAHHLLQVLIEEVIQKEQIDRITLKKLLIKESIEERMNIL